MTEISNTGAFKTRILDSVKLCQRVKQLLQPHEAKPQPSVVQQYTCTNGNTFNKLSIKMEVPLYSNASQNIKR